MSLTEFYLTKFNLPDIIAALELKQPSVKTSPDLNLTITDIPLAEDLFTVCGFIYTSEELRLLSAKLDSIIYIKDNCREKLEFYSDSYYKLRATLSAPTVEIDGVRMHRTKDVDPWEDSRRKATHAVKSGGEVLDTCSGLGYTAIWAQKIGARKVITCEKNENIVKIRQLNPWSRSLIQRSITPVFGDIYEVIQSFSDGQFDSVIHDPPRFSLAGELYSQAFYQHLNRVMKPKGRLFHYTGDPYSKGRGRKFLEGIITRLELAGFAVHPIPQDLGITAIKQK